MNYNAHDNFVLVAPRPVRLAAPSSTTPYSHFQNAIHRPPTRVAGIRLVADGVDRLKLGEDVVQDDVKATEPVDRDSVSPRASPRTNLSSEALEEFLSILQSSTLRFPPTSPILRASNGSAQHAFFYRRPTPSSLSPSFPSSEELGLSLIEPADEIRKETTSPTYPFKLIGGPLASPVSRAHTRNPFQRHPTYEAAFNGLLRPLSASPGPLPSANVALSPSAVPLPLPTPDETEMDLTS